MSDILYPPSRPQSVGEILDLAFRIFGATLLKVLPYATFAVIAGQLPTLYDLATGRTLVQAVLTQSIHDPVWWTLYFVAVFGTIIMTNAVILRQYALATGRAADTATELSRSARKIPGILLIGILIALGIVACVLPAGVLAGVLAGASGIAARGPGQASAGFMLSFALLALLPASWLLVRWSCSGTVYLLGERGPGASMRHSWQLTAGSFWRLSLVYSVGLVLLLVLYALSSVVGGLVALLFARGDVAVITAAGAAVVVLLGAVATPFYWALALAVLGDLSARREGTDLAQRLTAPAAR
jgi:hypothetical protein